MSLGWKKFSFFERDDRRDVQVPENTTCCSGSADHICFGCDDGRVTMYERAFTSQVVFEAHPHRVLQLVCLKAHKLLITLGKDDTTAASTKLKVWNLEGIPAGGSPALLRTIKAFPAAGKAPEVEVTGLQVHEAVWPRFSIAIGTSASHIHLLRGELGREKLQRSVLHMREGSASEPISGMAFTGESSNLCLFAVTQSQTVVFDVATSSKSLLDEMGADQDSTTQNSSGDLVVARPEAVYFYSVDGRGPCFVFEGQKRSLRWLRHYLVSVTRSSLPGGGPSSTALHLYDLRNKLIAATLPLQQEPRHVEVAWGQVVVVQADGGVAYLQEKELSAKLELLYSKSLYLVALNLATSEEAEPSAVAEIQRRYGDHLYAKHDYDAAMGQYVATIGYLEPSYVIRKFLDAQRIHNLTSYLEQLHSLGRAGADHTTLLLNCYTKLKDVAKLDAFLRGSGATEGSSSLPFDVETAVKVCRAAGYYEHALAVTQAAGEPEWYLDILLEDCHSYDEALVYLQSLPRQQSAAALGRHGKSLINNRAEATTALLMQLCTDIGDDSKADGDWVAKVADFAHLYAERPQALMLLCEFVLNSTRAPPNEAFLYHTLLQLYLADRLSDDEADGEASTSQTKRREQALELLKRGWPAGDEARYDPDHALMLCRMMNFRPGLTFLYENLRLFREILQVHMAAGDHTGLIEACARLGDVSRGGDPHLWTEVLQYFGSQNYDCSAQVKEVLAHIEAGALLPPLVVLQALAANPALKLSVVKGYAARTLAAEAAAVDEDRKVIARFQEETGAMRAEISELKTKARVFQNSRCALSGSALELPAVHFMCGHSFNARALGDNERECPLCAPQFRTILDIRRSLRAGAAEQDKFFTQLKNSADGFNVIAEFFGRGILNNTSSSSSS
ncbi:Vacuolar protein sorting-associated protein 11 homolog [Coccomyxa sp. Obi]|nr:Vacuolar protein sorting-associated protein 11 homolog [Coccomyxa sp. Obi]